MDEKKAEFDLLIQRTKQRIAIGQQLERSIRLLERPSSSIEKISGWGDVVRNTYNTGKDFFFRTKF